MYKIIGTIILGITFTIGLAQAQDNWYEAGESCVADIMDNYEVPETRVVPKEDNSGAFEHGYTDNRKPYENIITKSEIAASADAAGDAVTAVIRSDIAGKEDIVDAVVDADIVGAVPSLGPGGGGATVEEATLESKQR